MGVLDELDEAALIEILTKPRNAIMKQYQRLFEYENVRLHFTRKPPSPLPAKPWPAKSARAACA